MESVRLLARATIRARWGGLVAVGLLAGVIGGALLVSVTVARRTSTAFDRMVEATHMDDVRIASSFGPDATDRLIELPEITEAWVGSAMIGQLEGPNVAYFSVLSGPPRPADLHRPQVIEGRAADPDSIEEVVVNEQFAKEAGLSPGDVLTMHFLTHEEFLNFDEGFGEPDGPTAELHVVGVTREPAPAEGIAPIEATPAFEREYGQPENTVQFVRARVRGGSDGVQDVRRAVARLSETIDVPEGGDEVGAYQVIDPAESGEPVASAARVLVMGLLITAAVAALAGGTAVMQVLLRRHAAEEQGRRVESALGSTYGDQATARLVTGGLAATIAAVTAVGIAIGASGIGPIGSIATYEPDPGPAPHLVVLAVGGLAVLAAVVALDQGAFALVAKGGRRRRLGVRRSRIAASTAGTSPNVEVGVDLAFNRHGSRASVATRSARIGAVVGVAGVVATMVFAQSLDRLATSPTRWGWQGDLSVVDSTDEIVAELLDDERVVALADSESSAVQIGDQEVEASAFTVERGSLGWAMLDGTPPSSPDEVVVGARLAEELSLGVDSTVDVETGSGETRQLRVVGVGVGPRSGSEDFGDAVLLTKEGLKAAERREGRYRSAYVRLVPGTEDAFLAEHGQTYEVTGPVRPEEVDNLADLGVLPFVLGIFLGVVAVAALANALVVAVRQRRRDLGTLRAMGMLRRDVREAVCVAGMSIATVGVVVGLPLGIILGGTLWRIVASRAFVDGDPALTWQLLIVPVAALVIGALVSLVPGRRAAHRPPAWSLRTE